jgi:molybdopterin-dependent oxidoreductase-like protein protein
VAGVSALLLVVGSTRARLRPAQDARAADRRRFLGTLGLTAAAAVLAGGGGIVVGRVRGAGAAARRALGLPTPTSPAPPLPPGAQIPGMTPFTTPVDDFYRVDISLVTPQVDAASWTLTIDGMVDRPLTLTYDELLALPMIERDITLTCVSNEVGGPYVSSGRWLGVPFSTILERVGVQRGVEQVYSYSSDSGYTASTPLQAVADGRDAMIAYWTERKWATDGPVLTQSRIDRPKSLATLPKDKPVIAGVAWAQHRGITKVEVQVDDGDWQEADLATDAGVDLWRQWSLRFDGPAGLHTARVRATDATGETQPEQRTKVFPDGARGWHQIQFTTE